ncbi:hypothetical protein BH10ACI4_BH10ACI4_15150 [soil metagenome]
MARPKLSSSQPEVQVLALLGALQRILLPVVTAVAGITLLAWLIPFLGPLLPASWTLMKANTAILTLLSGCSIALCQPRRSDKAVRISRALGACVVLVSAVTLGEYLCNVSFGIDTFLIADAATSMPGRMSFQTAASFFVLGLILTNLRAQKGILSHLIDGLTLLLSLLMLVFTAGYIFGAMRLFGLSQFHRLSPQTLLCLIILTVLTFNRRTEYGIYSILIDGGIGGKTARLAAPVALLLPFTLATIRGIVTSLKIIPEQYGVALSAAFLSLLSFCFVLYISRRCKNLEGAIRELSLRDELTQIYNRRGFYLFAEQSLRLSHRGGDDFFLLFIDMDNLKQVNDSLGHEVGSELLKEMAALLRKNFRETDVIGRLGGDEFVVAGRTDRSTIMHAVTRLENAAKGTSEMMSRPYSLSFSLGCVIADEDKNETLDDLLQKADAIMYEAKASKKYPSAQTRLFESA